MRTGVRACVHACLPACLPARVCVCVHSIQAEAIFTEFPGAAGGWASIRVTRSPAIRLTWQPDALYHAKLHSLDPPFSGNPSVAIWSVSAEVRPCVVRAWCMQCARAPTHACACACACARTCAWVGARACVRAYVCECVGGWLRTCASVHVCASECVLVRARGVRLVDGVYESCMLIGEAGRTQNMHTHQRRVSGMVSAQTGAHDVWRNPSRYCSRAALSSADD
jgi:hypothetical protein